MGFSLSFATGQLAQDRIQLFQIVRQVRLVQSQNDTVMPPPCHAFALNVTPPPRCRFAEEAESDIMANGHMLAHSTPPPLNTSPDALKGVLTVLLH
jgi:hypothetical protein